MSRIKVLRVAELTDHETMERVVMVSISIPLGAIESVSGQVSDLSKIVGDVVIRSIEDVKQGRKL